MAAAGSIRLTAYLSPWAATIAKASVIATGARRRLNDGTPMCELCCDATEVENAEILSRPTAAAVAVAIDSGLYDSRR